MVTRDELFEKYHINESHNVWDNSIDNWMSVEIYRLMHNKLPDQCEYDTSTKYLIDFLDRKGSDWWFAAVQNSPHWGSLYLTAKRQVYKHADRILNEINKAEC